MGCLFFIKHHIINFTSFFSSKFSNENIKFNPNFLSCSGFFHLFRITQQNLFSDFILLYSLEVETMINIYLCSVNNPVTTYRFIEK